MEKNYDFRFKKTDAAIFRALSKLLETDDFDKISISKLCSISSINRTTFYDHYKDKDELLRAFINDIFNIKTSSIDKITDNNSMLDQVDFILNIINKKSKFFNSLIKSSKEIYIKDSITLAIKSKCLLNDDLIFFIGGVSAIITDAIYNNSFDKEYLYTYIRDLSFQFNLFNKNKEN